MAWSEVFVSVGLAILLIMFTGMVFVQFALRWPGWLHSECRGWRRSAVKDGRFPRPGILGVHGQQARSLAMAMAARGTASSMNWRLAMLSDLVARHYNLTDEQRDALQPFATALEAARQRWSRGGSGGHKSTANAPDLLEAFAQRVERTAEDFHSLQPSFTAFYGRLTPAQRERLDRDLMELAL